MTTENAQVNEATETESELVSAKAYKETQADMFKYKNKLKETEAMLNQLKADKENAEHETLKANEQWKILYEKNQKQLEEINAQRNAEKEQFVNYHKKSAVIKELGGFKKDVYNDFINVGAVELDEQGNVIQESLLSEVNRIKQTYPELLKGMQASNLPSEAPKGFQPTNFTKDYSQLSSQEKLNLKLELLNKK